MNKHTNIIYFVLSLSVLTLMACGGSSNVPVSSVRHAEGGSHASHISADNTITVVSTIENGITVWDLANKRTAICVATSR